MRDPDRFDLSNQHTIRPDRSPGDIHVAGCPDAGFSIAVRVPELMQV